MNEKHNAKRVQDLIAIWSMRPAPNTPEGDAWEAGCLKGFEWGFAEAVGAGSAKFRFDELVAAEDNLSAIERLRLFCSLAMNGQDWQDAESFFENVAAELQTK